ncbi:hypothetical protein ACHAWF_016563 [Thalassiosira exigua]
MRDVPASRGTDESIATGVEKGDVGRGRHFTSIKGEQYYRVRYEWEYSKFLNSSRSELRKIHDAYPRAYVDREVEDQDKMWRCAMEFQKEAFGNGEQWSPYRRKKLLCDLRDNFYELTTNRYISRPNFECCVLKASRGYSHGTLQDDKFVRAVRSVYNSFDSLCKEVFDWKSFLFYLHFMLDASIPTKEQLLSAFSMIGNKQCIDLQELGMILIPLLKASVTGSILTLMGEAFAQIKASMQKVDENCKSTALTITVFEKMLDMDGLGALFGRSRTIWGRGRVYPVFVSRWEEEFYNKTLLQLVKNTRRDEAIRDKLGRDVLRTKLRVWKSWLDHAKYQSSLRRILTTINRRVNQRRKARGLFAFSRCAICHRATLVIQRVGRGFLGRLVARKCWMIYSSATLIQTHFRMHLAKKRLHALYCTYIWAIVEVQRLIRGALGRRLAYRKLMTIVEQERVRIAKEREKLEMERGVRSLIKLQAFWRRKIATAKSMELRQKMQREALIRQAMETERDLFLRERQIYQRQLESFYKSMKDEHLNNDKIQSKVAQDQIKVRTLKRRLKKDEIDSAEPDNSEQLAMEKWKRDWGARIEAGVMEMKSNSIHCLDQPDNATEKRTRAIIKERIKGRVPQVLARAKERGIPMETKEAKAVAREEILHIIGEEERTRLSSAMEKAFMEREKLKEEARLRAEAKAKDAHARATVYAVSLVSNACRRWLARKELRRRCLETYEKKFDEWNHAFFYRNKITGDISWSKPKAMGFFDIPAKDEWKIIRDAHNFPYYFNPFLIEMRWTPPADESMCCGVVPHTWWREYPVRSGPCPNFGRQLNEDDGKRYCADCAIYRSTEDVYEDAMIEER